MIQLKNKVTFMKLNSIGQYLLIILFLGTFINQALCQNNIYLEAKSEEETNKEFIENLCKGFYFMLPLTDEILVPIKGPKYKFNKDGTFIYQCENGKKIKDGRDIQLGMETIAGT